MDDELLAAEIGDEDFFEEVEGWTPGSKTTAKRKIASNIEKAEATRKKNNPLRKPATQPEKKKGRKAKA